MKAQNQLEKGQILILFVFGLVVLLAFTALALDGGMVYADRRYGQSVADAAALAGAQAAEKEIKDVLYNNFNCASSSINTAIYKAKVAAINRANANLPANELFPDLFDDDPSDGMGVEVTCEVVPAAASPTGSEQRYLKISVQVASETQTAFAHLVFGEESIRNEVVSVVHLSPAMPLAQGNAIVSLNNKPCSGNDKGTVFNGGGSNNTSVNVKNGGIFSNSCISRNGHFSVKVEDGSVVYYTPGGYQDKGSGSIVPQPNQVTERISVPTTFHPACGDVKTMSDATLLGSAKVLHPGTYYGGISIQNGEWIFEEGLYCLYGNLKINGGNVTGGCSVAQYTGPGAPGPAGTCDSGGVTFYFQPDSNNGKAGEVNIMGGAIVKLYAPLHSEAKPEIPGMLFYMPENNPGEINLTGTSETRFRGTILAPTGDVNIGGTQQTSADYAVQVIGWNVTVSGNSSININYDSSIAVVIPAYADQHK